MNHALAPRLAALAAALAVLPAAAAPPAVMPLGDSITYGRGNGVDIPGGYRGPLFSAIFGVGDYVDFVGAASGNASTVLTTAGETHHNGYRSAFLDQLQANLAGVAPIAGGATNNEGGYWLTGTEAGRAPVFPDAILLLGGVNDIAGTGNVPVATALARLDTLLGEIFTLRPQTAVFVSNLTPLTGTPGATYGAKAAEFNAGIPAVLAPYAAAGRGVTLVDMHAALNDPATDITADGVHPTQAGYDKMATTWAAALTAGNIVVANARPTFTGATNAAWNSGASWSGGAVPAATSAVRFDQARNTNLNLSTTVDSVVLTNAAAFVAGASSTATAAHTLTISSGLEHTANANTSVMRIQTIALGASQDWRLNGPIGTDSASSAGFTLAAHSTSAARNTLDLGGHTLRKVGSGQLSLGNLSVGDGSIAIEEGSVRFATGNMGTGATVGMQLTGTGTVTVKGAAAVMFSAASNAPAPGTSFNVTKAIRMEGTTETPSILHYAGTQNSVAPTIAAPIEWAGVTNAVSFWSSSTGVTGTVPWTFSGDWSGSGTVRLVTAASGTQTNGRITVFSGSNAGFAGLVENQQSDGFSTIRFGSAAAGSAAAEWRLGHATATYQLNGFDVALGALSGMAGTLANGAATNATATLGGKNIDASFAGVIQNGGSGTLALTKTGTGTQTLAGTSTYTGGTTVQQGRLAVDGSIAASSGVTVAAGAVLGGWGSVPTIGGAGLVSPGNSPGILTTAGLTVDGGLDFTFELATTGSPNYADRTASVNDVLRLTGTANAPLSSANTVAVLFGSPAAGDIGPGDVFRGGTYFDLATTPEARDTIEGLIAPADWRYYVYGDGNGTHLFEGTRYYTLAEYDPSLSIERSVVAETANFAGGTVSGGVTQFSVVPEPGAALLIVAGAAAVAGVHRCRKRR